MARLKLELWESAIADCNECLKLSADRNMKAHYILSQAQEKLGDYEAAVQSALSAHMTATALERIDFAYRLTAFELLKSPPVYLAFF